MSLLKKVCVKNLHGTANRDVPTGYTSWLDFCGVQKPCNCANIECRNRAEVGAHVKKVGGADAAWYIVPFCKKCNASEENIFVLESALKKLR